MTMREEKIIIRELTPDLMNDYLNYFDHVAFADNPQWASCYCFFNHAPHDKEDWGKRTAQQNRAAVTERIAARKMRGYLAYSGGKVVGWCNAAPRAWMTTLKDQKDAEKIGAIVCFVIAKSLRGTGIATRLLNAACDGFKQNGFEIAEGYPRANAETDASNYHGPLAMYLAAWFEKIRDEDGVMTVSKKL
ncbi:MAG: GNAT family N-acetyltransferase [Chloroflexi bacterium]|nr:GNAT family N-acetyltransferase [Chloroflexota bacterium]